MKRTVTYLTIVLLTLTVANCGPGLLAPGPPLPGLGPAFEWIALFAIIVAAGVWLSRSKFAAFFQTYDKRGLRPPRFSGSVTRRARSRERNIFALQTIWTGMRMYQWSEDRAGTDSLRPRESSSSI
jgi:hypothetical protein